jgi:hypothetical protein
MACEWVKSVWLEYKKGWRKEDIYWADGTGLFYNMMPDTEFKGEEYVGKQRPNNCLMV